MTQEEKKLPEGLEEEITRYLREDHDRDTTVRDVARHFTKWQKAKMMEETVEGFIFQSADYYPKELIARYEGNLQMGDKVKIIIVKED